MKKILASLLILLASAAAYAETRYYCACQSNSAGSAHGSCAAGSDANNGLSAALPKLNFNEGIANAMAAGDVARFCTGGFWNFTSAMTFFNLNATSSSPITFESYAPPSGATGRPTWSTVTAETSLVGTGEFGNTTYHGGYTFRGLRFLGGGQAMGESHFGFAAFLYTRDVVFEDMEMTRLAIPIYIGEVRRFTLRNSNLHHNYAQGFLGGADDMIVEGNTFSKNSSAFEAPGLGHNMYFNSHPGNRMRIRNNIFEDPGNAETDGTTCSQGNLTFHGEVYQLIVEGNIIRNSGTIATGCGGISLTPGYASGYAEQIQQGVVRGNRVINAPFDIAMSPSMIIENNSVLWTIASSVSCINLPARLSGTLTYSVADGDVLDTGAKVRNNSCRHDAPSEGAIGINTNGATQGPGTGLEVTNNLVTMGTGTGTAYCYRYAAQASYTVHNNNLGFGCDAWSPTHATRALAAAGGFFDTSSLTSDPLLLTTPTVANNANMRLQTGSPARAAGNSTYRARLAIDGWARPASPSIGAFDDNNP